MTTDTGQTTEANADEGTTTQTLRDKATDLREKASSLLQDGIELVKNNPAAAAAVVGGVAATVAGTVYREQIAAAVKGDSKSKPGPKSTSSKS